MIAVTDLDFCTGEEGEAAAAAGGGGGGDDGKNEEETREREAAKAAAEEEARRRKAEEEAREFTAEELQAIRVDLETRLVDEEVARWAEGMGGGRGWLWR